LGVKCIDILPGKLTMNSENPLNQSFYPGITCVTNMDYGPKSTTNYIHNPLNRKPL